MVEILKGTENPNTSIPLLKLSEGLGVTTHVSWNWQSVMRRSCSSFPSGQTLPDELKATQSWSGRSWGNTCLEKACIGVTPGEDSEVLGSWSVSVEVTLGQGSEVLVWNSVK